MIINCLWMRILVGLLAFSPLLAQAVPVDVNGDGKVGPHEAIDLSENWKGDALQQGGLQPWQIDGATIFYNTGNVGIGSATPHHRLRISGGPLWTSDAWTGSLELDEAAAIGWRGVAGSQRFGIGYSIGGLHFFHTDGDPGTATSEAQYAMTITDTGSVRIGSNATSGLAKLSVVTDDIDHSAVQGQAIFGIGVHGITGENGIAAIYGYASPSSEAKAGRFDGDVLVNGVFTDLKSTFQIDHPLDPENKVLSHSSVESPDMMNIYNGNAITDATGYAEIILPDWFEPLNKDFRYQLTVIGQFAQAMVSEEIDNNSFTIQTDKPNVKVSWQVTGLRHDAWAKANPNVVEKEKSETDRGKYLAPEVHGQPKEMGIHYRPEMDLPSRTASKVE